MEGNFGQIRGPTESAAEIHSRDLSTKELRDLQGGLAGISVAVVIVVIGAWVMIVDCNRDHREVSLREALRRSVHWSRWSRLLRRLGGPKRGGGVANQRRDSSPQPTSTGERARSIELGSVPATSNVEETVSRPQEGDGGGNGPAADFIGHTMSGALPVPSLSLIAGPDAGSLPDGRPSPAPTDVSVAGSQRQSSERRRNSLPADQDSLYEEPTPPASRINRTIEEGA